MIILENYSELDTYIKIVEESYTIIFEDSYKNQVNGIGGISEDGELVGIYVIDKKLHFQYNSTSYEVTPRDLMCHCENIDNGKYRFIVKNKGRIICDIEYKPYVSPFVLTFGGDDDEFDFLLYLSKLLKDEASIERLWRYYQ